MQYRDKLNNSAKRLEDASKLLNLCNRFSANLIINDDTELALQINAQGVHLGQGDGDVASARARLGPQKIIGVTCHDSLALAQKAIDDGASYIAFGRFFSSSTKPDARAAPLSLLNQAKKQFPNTTIVAIGGIALSNAAQVLAAGADMIAVCQGLFAAGDIETQARALNGQ